jgi:hypothetical protein
MRTIQIAAVAALVMSGPAQAENGCRASKQLCNHFDIFFARAPNAAALIEAQDENSIPVFDPRQAANFKAQDTRMANYWIESAQRGYDAAKFYWPNVSSCGRKACVAQTAWQYRNPLADVAIIDRFYETLRLCLGAVFELEDSERPKEFRP